MSKSPTMTVALKAWSLFHGGFHSIKTRQQDNRLFLVGVAVQHVDDELLAEKLETMLNKFFGKLQQRRFLRIQLCCIILIFRLDTSLLVDF